MMEDEDDISAYLDGADGVLSTSQSVQAASELLSPSLPTTTSNSSMAQTSLLSGSTTTQSFGAASTTPASPSAPTSPQFGVSTSASTPDTGIEIDTLYTPDVEGAAASAEFVPESAARALLAPSPDSSVAKAIPAELQTAARTSSGREASALSQSHLPWGALKEKVAFPASIQIDSQLQPGEFVMRTMFAEFAVQAERKIEKVLAEPLERSISKSLQRGEDQQFDQLLSSLCDVAEHCLPSIIRVLFQWYSYQLGVPDPLGGTAQFDQPLAKVKAGLQNRSSQHGSNVKVAASLAPGAEKDYLQQRRDLAVEFLFCLCLIEVLKQFHYHPGNDDLVNAIENVAFKHFSYQDPTILGPNAQNNHIISDLFAEVIGVLAQTRFQSVRKKFMSSLRELSAKDQTTYNVNSIISLLMGMKFFRVKMVPIEEFEASFGLMQECAQYFLDLKDKDVRHALAGLFVEILVPVAARVKNEVNVPCLKNFVEKLYAPTLDLATKRKHALALYPLVTCLLCVSQKQFFLHNWPYFLTMCLSQLKNRDPKTSRVALESLYRLIWVYMIRIKCESNAATQSRLQSIVNSLFPKGAKVVVPRDAPLNIFIKIIHFIAQERLDFAMREMVFDLLCVGRHIKGLTPERMSIGLRAFLVITDSLQQKEGEPPMPRTIGILPSGNTLRVKKTFLSKMLTEEGAKGIGMGAYYYHVRKAFNNILRALDFQVGRVMIMTRSENLHKEPEDIITGERKPKIDLFKTCVAAIPRLLPDGMSRHDLVELLSRLTMHLDEELRGLAFQALQNMVSDLQDWKEDVILGFIQFLVKEIPDTQPQLVDNALRMLVQLLGQWKTAATNSLGVAGSAIAGGGKEHHDDTPSHKLLADRSSHANVLHGVESVALMMLCHCRPISRKLALMLLKEARLLFNLLGSTRDDDPPVIDIVNHACPAVLEKCLPYLPPSEKAAMLTSSTIDLHWVIERSLTVWPSSNTWDSGQTNQDVTQSSVMNVSSTNAPSTTALSASVASPAGASGAAASPQRSTQEDLPNPSHSSTYVNVDPWCLFLSGILESERLTGTCRAAIHHAWPAVCARLNALLPYVDPSSPMYDNRQGILTRAPTRKQPSEYSTYISLWCNYLIFASAAAPSSSGAHVSSSGRSTTPDPTSSPESSSREASDLMRPTIIQSPVTLTALLKIVVPFLRVDSPEIQDATLVGLGQINAGAVKFLLEELQSFIREACERKPENMRRRMRRNNLRLVIFRLLDLIASRGVFSATPWEAPSGVFGSHALARQAPPGQKVSVQAILLDLIDGARHFLETEEKQDSLAQLQNLRLHFASFMTHFVGSLSAEAQEKVMSGDLKRGLFHLFAGWAGRYGARFATVSGSSTGSNQKYVSSGHRDSKDGHPPKQLTALELGALRAMASVLCCGEAFDPSGFEDQSQPMYIWLDTLLHSPLTVVQEIGHDTVKKLLELNPDASTLLDWTIDRCYTQDMDVAILCFLALGRVFLEGGEEYPCDHIAMLNVALLLTSSPKRRVADTALHLLIMLDKRFLQNTPLPVGLMDESSEEIDISEYRNCASRHHPSSSQTANFDLKTFSDALFVACHARSQVSLSEELARLQPELSMPMFSEITHRFQTAHAQCRPALLRQLLPWLHNIELIDSSLSPSNPLTSLNSKISESQRDFEAPLKGEGWGSTQSTEMVLNNLYYIMARFGDQYPLQMERIWAALCKYWINNLKVILRYLIVVTGMAPYKLLNHTKRVIVYLGRAQPEHLVEGLVSELQIVETVNVNVERTETPPFFRFNQQKKPSIPSDFIFSHSIYYRGSSTANDIEDSSFEKRGSEGGESLAAGAETVSPSSRGPTSAQPDGVSSAESFSKVASNVADVVIAEDDLTSASKLLSAELKTTTGSCPEGSSGGPTVPGSAPALRRHHRNPSYGGSGNMTGFLQTGFSRKSHHSSGEETAKGSPVEPRTPSISSLRSFNSIGSRDVVEEPSSTGRSAKTQSAPCGLPGVIAGSAAALPAPEIPEDGVKAAPIVALFQQNDPEEGASKVGSSGDRHSSGSGMNCLVHVLDGGIPSDLSRQNSFAEPTGPIPDEAEAEEKTDDFFMVQLAAGKSSAPVTPYPLPMPAYGGFFAPMTEYLPDSFVPTQGFHRCNLATILLSDLVFEGVEGIDWSQYIPLLFHMAFLGLDHTRALIHEHCKQLILHLLVLCCVQGISTVVGRVLLGCQAIVGTNDTTTFLNPGACSGGAGSATPTQARVDPVNGSLVAEPSTSLSIAGPTPGGNVNAGTNSIGQSTFSLNSMITCTTDTPAPSCDGLHDVDGATSAEEVARILTDFLLGHKGRPLWSYEDITPKAAGLVVGGSGGSSAAASSHSSHNHLRSADTLSQFVRLIARLCSLDAPPISHLELRWAQIALQMALSCPSRHYAGRSFQIFRSLQVPVSSTMLSNIVSRLVETVAEVGDEMQGYVTEILLTLQSCLRLDPRPPDMARDVFRSSPLHRRLLTTAGADASRRIRIGVHNFSPRPLSPTHGRSTSASIPTMPSTTLHMSGAAGGHHPLLHRHSHVASPQHDMRAAAMRYRSSTEADGPQNKRALGSMVHSQSAQSLNVGVGGLTGGLARDLFFDQDQLILLTQMTWISVALLESDFEYEFLLALKLLDQLVPMHVDLARPEVVDKLRAVLQEMKWTNFPGLQAMVLKGCTSPSTFEPTIHFIAKLTPYCNCFVVMPVTAGASTNHDRNGTGTSSCFPLNVIALLPYMMYHYDNHHYICINAAIAITKICLDGSSNLANLAAVMDLYSKGTFGKDVLQWAKCVVKYLHDNYAEQVMPMMTLLAEVLDKGPTFVQQPILQTIYCILQYVDLSVVQVQSINGDVLRIVSKFSEGIHWRECLKIQKLVVSRLSTLSSNAKISIGEGSVTHTFPDFEIYKKELPGKTMDFSFDFSQLPSDVGEAAQQKAAAVAALPSADNFPEAGEMAAAVGRPSTSSRGAMATPSTVGTGHYISWKKPQLSQTRTRERLMSLLEATFVSPGFAGPKTENHGAAPHVSAAAPRGVINARGPMLPKTPSVIFSQGSEILDRRSSVCSGSNDELSTNDGLSGDGKFDDAASDERQFKIFRDFDFLDIELENETEGDRCDFNWGLGRRRRSLNSLATTPLTPVAASVGASAGLHNAGVAMDTVPGRGGIHHEIHGAGYAGSVPNLVSGQHNRQETSERMEPPQPRDSSSVSKDEVSDDDDSYDDEAPRPALTRDGPGRRPASNRVSMSPSVTDEEFYLPGSSGGAAFKRGSISKPGSAVGDRSSGTAHAPPVSSMIESQVEETCSSIEPPSDVDTDLGPQEDPAEEREDDEEEEEDEDDDPLRSSRKMDVLSCRAKRTPSISSSSTSVPSDAEMETDAVASVVANASTSIKSAPPSSPEAKPVSPSAPPTQPPPPFDDDDDDEEEDARLEEEHLATDNFMSAYIPLQSGAIEDTWRRHVMAIMGDATCQHAVHSFYFFSRLYKEIRRSCANLTREACQYLTTEESLRPVSTQILNMLGLLTSQAECPYAFVDAASLIACDLLERHKFLVLEIHEVFETLLLRREHTRQVLERVKLVVHSHHAPSRGSISRPLSAAHVSPHPKLQSPASPHLGASMGGSAALAAAAAAAAAAADLDSSVSEMDDQLAEEKPTITLCKCLYKLHFQLLLLFQSYAKLVSHLSSALENPIVTDCSNEVTEIKPEIMKAVYQVDNLDSGNEGSPGAVLFGEFAAEADANQSSSAASRAALTTALSSTLSTRRFPASVTLLRRLRSAWPEEEFGDDEDEDVEVLLSAFCRQRATTKPGVVVITKSEHDLTEVSRRLLDVNLQLSSSIRLLQVQGGEISATPGETMPSLIGNEIKIASGLSAIDENEVKSPSVDKFLDVEELLNTSANVSSMSEAYTRSEPKKSKQTKVPPKGDELNDTQGSASENETGGAAPAPVVGASGGQATTASSSGVGSIPGPPLQGMAPQHLHPQQQPSTLLEQTLEDVEEVKEEVNEPQTREKVEEDEEEEEDEEVEEDDAGRNDDEDDDGGGERGECEEEEEEEATRETEEAKVEPYKPNTRDFEFNQDEDIIHL